MIGPASITDHRRRRAQTTQSTADRRPNQGASEGSRYVHNRPRFGHVLLICPRDGHIASSYHAWHGDLRAGEYADVPGLCRSAALEEVRGHGFVLTPGRYVGAEDVEDEGEAFEEKIKTLARTLEPQFAESARLDQAVRDSLAGLGYVL